MSRSRHLMSEGKSLAMPRDIFHGLKLVRSFFHALKRRGQIFPKEGRNILQALRKKHFRKKVITFKVFEYHVCPRGVLQKIESSLSSKFSREKGEIPQVNNSGEASDCHFFGSVYSTSAVVEFQFLHANSRSPGCLSSTIFFPPLNWKVKYKPVGQPGLKGVKLAKRAKTKGNLWNPMTADNL